MLTYRKQLAELLTQGSFTLHELSVEIHLSVKEVLHHLEHVRKSTHQPLRFVMDPANCLKCGFVFKDRRRLSPPSRCPKCKSSHVQDPRYEIRSLAAKNTKKHQGIKN